MVNYLVDLSQILKQWRKKQLWHYFRTWGGDDGLKMEFRKAQEKQIPGVQATGLMHFPELSRSQEAFLPGEYWERIPGLGFTRHRSENWCHTEERRTKGLHADILILSHLPLQKEFRSGVNPLSSQAAQEAGDPSKERRVREIKKTPTKLSGKRRKSQDEGSHQTE